MFKFIQRLFKKKKYIPPKVVVDIAIQARVNDSIKKSKNKKMKDQIAP